MICGPDISVPLMRVLSDIRAEFGRWNGVQRMQACRTATDPGYSLDSVMAWDIIELYLPHTEWLYSPRMISAGCGQPKHGEPATPEIEDAVLSPCGNSVQVGNGCYLAGTVNYAMFGEICRLCWDESPLGQSFSIGVMSSLIRLWKAVDSFDDPGPPIDWATWGFNRGSVYNPPGGRAENRCRCQGRCSRYFSRFRFTWRWLPVHPNHYER